MISFLSVILMQSFNRECSATLQLSNTGLVGFDFRCLDSELVVNPDDDLKAGEPLLVPASVSITVL